MNQSEQPVRRYGRGGGLGFMRNSTQCRVKVLLRNMLVYERTLNRKKGFLIILLTIDCEM